MKKIEEILYGIILLISPLIVFGKVFEVEENDIRKMTAISNSLGKQVDFFTYYKGIILVICTLILFGIFLYENVEKKIGRYSILALLVGISTVVSYVFSPFKDIALIGMVTRHEGVLVELSYYVLFLVSLSFFRDRFLREKALRYIMASSLIIFTIGIFQFFNMNIFESALGKSIITGFKLQELGKLKFQFGQYAIYSTHSNPNYMGTYAVMLFYLFLGRFLKSSGRSTILIGGITLLAFANLIGAQSRAGLVGFQGAGIFFLILYRKKLLKNIKKIVGIGVLCIGIWFGMNMYTDGALETIESLGRGSMAEIYGVKNRDGGIRIDGKAPLSIITIDERLLLLDENDKKLDTIFVDGRYQIKDPKYDNYEIRTKNEKGAFVLIYNELEVPLLSRGNMMYIGVGPGRYSPVVGAKRVETLDRYQSKGSNRVYIWSRAIPKLLERPLTGWGSDTFPLVFPQNDFFGKKVFYGTSRILVDKAHNYFIQIGVNNGLVALAFLIILFICYGIHSLIEGIRDDRDIFIFLATLAYLFTMLFNDSVVSSAPIFWCLIAMNIAMISEKKILRSGG